MKFWLVIIIFITSYAQERIVFTMKREIHSMNLDGSDIKQLTDYKVPGHVPVSLRAAVTDNNIISYIYDPVHHGWMSTYTMNKDGSNKIRVSKEPSSKDASTWDTDISPDGKHFVFVSNRGSNDEIYIMKHDGSGIKNISMSDVNDGSPKFFSNKEVIYPQFDDGETKFIVSKLDGSNKKTIWTRKGKVDYIKTKDQTFLIFHQNSVLYLIDLKNKKENVITKKVGKYSMLNFSPDGKHVVFCNNQDYISIIGIDGKNYRTLLKGYDPVWVR